MTKTRILTAAACASAALLLCSAARADTDRGRADSDPWSGYWWQYKTGGLVGPLTQYDRLLGTAAADWERDEHVASDSPEWFGHCHAWAASSVCEKEPRRQRVVRQVPFGVGHQKGLLAACHDQDVSNSYGDRFGDDEGSEDQADISPVELWRLLQTYVKQRKIPLIVDLEAGEQVWNYPIYDYRVDYEQGRGDWHRGTLRLVAADNHVAPDYVGTKRSLYTYTFRFKMEGGAVVSDSGEWTGRSAEDHPDFAWYPYVAVAENPEIDVDEVSKIVGYAVGGSNPPPDDGDEPPEDNPPEVPPPTDEPEDDGGEPPRPVEVDDLLSPEELLALVTNRTSSFALDMFVDRGDGGRYRAGEPIRISFRSGEPGYLYIFDVDAQGEVRLVFPRQGQPNRIKSDVLYDLPAKDRKPTFTAQGTGQHDLKAIVTARPVEITGLTDVPGRQEPPPGGNTNTRRAPEPQRMVVCPTKGQWIRLRLLGFFRKGEPSDEPPPEKLGPSAQDLCSYFVLPGAGQQQSP